MNGAAVVAVAMSSVAAMPVLLVAGLAILLQDDFGFGEGQLGVAIAVYFGSGAVASAPTGRLVERLGPRTAALLGLSCTVVSLLGIALLARSWEALLLWLCIGGIANVLTQLGASVIVLRRVDARRHGVALGVVQAAVPMSALMAGLSLPLLGLTLGWRWPFIVAAAVVPLVAFLVPRDGVHALAERPSNGDGPVGGLALLSFGMALASAGATASATFIVASSVDRGLPAADAGLVLGCGSLVGLAARVLTGWLADRMGHASLLMVAGLMSAAGLGQLGLAFASDSGAIMFLSVLVFAGAWGWSSVALLALTRAYPSSPGRAMGTMFIGVMAGAVLGPLAFGIVAEHEGYVPAWVLLASVAPVAAGTTLLSRRMISRDAYSTPSKCPSRS